VLLALGRTGTILEEDAKLHFKMQNETIMLLIDNKLIDKRKIYKLEMGLKNYFKLTKKGCQYVKQELGLKNVYRSSSNQVLHDLKLSEFYCSLETKIRNTWITETEMHLELLSSSLKNLDILRAIDGAYKDKNELIGVEVISKNYNSNEIQLKQVIANAIGCSKLILIKL